jgi:hypothetical protein
VTGAIVLTVLGGLLAAWVWRKASQSWLVQAVWRFFTGLDLDGQPRPHRRSRFRRAQIRTGSVAVMFGLLYGLLAARTVTVWTVAAVVLAGAATGAWWVWWYRLRHLPHHWRYVRPLRRRLTPMLEGAPPRLAIEPDRSRAKVWLPPEFMGTDREWAALDNTVSVTLGIEAPTVDRQLQGRARYIVYTHSEPPPRLVTWGNDVEQRVAALGPDELMVGIGKQDKTVKVSLRSDSPHFGISMGTGGGKSNLATFWLVQELRRGAIALILDAKLFSHPWAFKDMDAEYGQLPNVGYARRTSALHDAMVWLGDEIERRNQVAERIIDAKGNLHGDVGPRLWIIAEELNMATPLLKQHWAEIRDREQPKKSPALTGMAQVAFAGRAVKMHLIVIGQQLTAETLGGGAVRENIGVRCLARYRESSWNMLVGRDVPMPPSPEVDGRVQCVAGAAVSETQTPLMDLELARELAVGGVLTPCPAGMPGIAVPARVALPVGAPDQRLSYDSPPELPAGVTLAEAVREGIWGGNLAALQKASHRPGFPPKLADRGTARVWEQADLYAYVAGKRWQTDD